LATHALVGSCGFPHSFIPEGH